MVSAIRPYRRMAQTRPHTRKRSLNLRGRTSLATPPCGRRRTALAHGAAARATVAHARANGICHCVCLPGWIDHRLLGAASQRGRRWHYRAHPRLARRSNRRCTSRFAQSGAGLRPVRARRLLSLGGKRPLMFLVARRFAARGNGAKAAAWNARWRRPGFYRTMRLLTLVWGAACLIEACLGTAAVLSLRPDVAPVVEPVLGLGTVAGLLAWTTGHVRHSLRADAADAGGGPNPYGKEHVT
jgi:hypothetical protein